MLRAFDGKVSPMHNPGLIARYRSHLPVSGATQSLP